MNNRKTSPSDKVEIPSKKKFELLLKDKAFVDYFNLFLCLPVFGERILYRIKEECFEFEPYFRRRKYKMKRASVVEWLRTKRYEWFVRSKLHFEYQLCIDLRNTMLTKDIFKDTVLDEEVCYAFKDILLENIIGHFVGFQLFKDSLRGTSGERVYRCLVDIARCCSPHTDEETKKALIFRIKMMYLMNGADYELPENTKLHVFRGSAIFDRVSIDETTIGGPGYAKALFYEENLTEKLDEVLSRNFLTNILKEYWVPRFVMHVLKNIRMDLLPHICLRVSDTEQNKALTFYAMFPTFRKLSKSMSEGFMSCVDIMQNVSLNPVKVPLKNSHSLSDIQLDESEMEFFRKFIISGKGSSPNFISFMKSLYSGSSSSCSSSSDQKRKWTKSISCNQTKTSETSRSSSAPIGSGVSSFESVVRTLRSHSATVTEWSLLNQKPDRLTIAIGPDLQRTIPTRVKEYLTGDSNFLWTELSGSQYKLMCGFAADSLTSRPFRLFLQREDGQGDLQKLQFWGDLREYFLAGDFRTSVYKNFLEKSIVHRMRERYLSFSAVYEIFDEKKKMDILQMLMYDNKHGLLEEQKFISDELRVSWSNFIDEDRKNFMRFVCRELAPGETSADNDENGVRRVEGMDEYGDWKITSDCFLGISQKNLWALFDLALRTVSLKDFTSEFSLDDIAKALTTDDRLWATSAFEISSEKYTLYLPKKSEKIDIENIKVSKKVILPDNFTKVSMRSRLFMADFSKKASRIKKRPIILKKPENLGEIFSNEELFERFMNFLKENDSEFPLLFIRAVSNLTKYINSDQKMRNNLNDVHKRFFGKAAKYGSKLQCDEDIIEVIAGMDTASMTFVIMSAARAAVLRSLEAKWLTSFQDTIIKAKSEKLSQESLFTGIEDFNLPIGKPLSEHSLEVIHKKWKLFLNPLTVFLRMMKQPQKVQMLLLFIEIQDRETRELFLNPNDQSKRVKGDHSSVSLCMSISSVKTKKQEKARCKLDPLKLSRDALFWAEAEKYKEIYDNLLLQENAVFGKNLLKTKADVISECYLTSEVLPKIQINVPVDMANSCCYKLLKDGCTRDLFHSPSILILPGIYRAWSAMMKEWIQRNCSMSYLTELEDLVHCEKFAKLSMLDDSYLLREIKRIYNEIGDSRLSFSLYLGIRLHIPMSHLKKKSSLKDGRKETKKCRKKTKS